MVDDDTPHPAGAEIALPAPLGRRAAALGVAWIALVDAALWRIYYHPAAKEPYLDEWQYRWSSDLILLGGPASPKLIWPPATGQILAALRRWLGDLPPAILAMQLLHTALLGLCAVLFLAAGMLVTVPARLESWRFHGDWVIADSSTFGLWVGLHDRWRSDAYLDDTGQRLAEYLEISESPAERRRLYRQRVRDRVEERGLLPIFVDKMAMQPFRLLSAKTNLITQLPGPACRGHLPSYRDPPPALGGFLTLGSHALHAATLAAFAFGLVLWPRWRHVVPWMHLGLLAYFSAVFFVGHVEGRYAFWFWPMLCVFAGWFAVHVVARLRSGAPLLDPGRRSGLRWAAGAVLALLLVWFAFAGPHLDRMCA